MNLKELIVQESFHQNFLVEAEKFIELCKNRDLNIKDGDLEFLEKTCIVMPVTKVRNNIVFNSTAELKELYTQDQMVTEFMSWEKFYEQKDGYREKIIFPYYHMYQIHNVEAILNIKQKLTEISEKDLEKLRQISKDEEKFIELLFLVQNKYLPNIRKYSFIYMAPGDSLDKLKNLQEDIIPEKIIEKLNIEIKDIMIYREKIGYHALRIDPLEKWFDIVKCIREDKRQELKGKALLAQDYYLIFEILSLLLEDLGKKRVNVESWCNPIGVLRKLTLYSKYKELDYNNRGVLERTLHEYGISPKPRLVLIVEGYTEEEFIPIVSGAMNISLDNFGIKIINIRGVDKDGIRELLVHYATPYFGKIYDEYRILDRTKVFILLDNEGKRSWTKKLIRNPRETIDKMMEDVLEIIRDKGIFLGNDKIDILKKQTIYYYFWHKNLEYDNFTDDRELLIELKKYERLHNKQFNMVLDDVKECREKNKNLKKFVEDNTDNSTSLNKEEFGKQLGMSIAREIKYRKNKSDNQRPIEKVLYEIIESL